MKAFLENSGRGVQMGLLVVLVAGIGGALWLLRTQPTEFIYSLF